MRSPGATQSGFIRPSAVGPRDEKDDVPNVCGCSLCTEPTAIASSRLAGSPMDMPMLRLQLSPSEVLSDGEALVARPPAPPRRPAARAGAARRTAACVRS